VSPFTKGVIANPRGGPKKEVHRVRLVTTVSPETMKELQRRAQAIAKGKRPSIGAVIDTLVKAASGRQKPV